MKKILLFGAGKSATTLIDYLGKTCDENEWKLLVCDANLSLAESKIKSFSSAEAVSFDVSNDEKRHEYISNADLIISMLPPGLHFLVAIDCVAFSKNLLTASYIDEKIKSLEDEILEKGLIFLGEMGLDPGIDHMSAMKMIHKIKNEGGKITSFKSHCGGLVSPESDDNPWHYKITWNPANVVMAGSSGAVFLEDGKKVEIPYSQIFNDDTNIVDVPGLFPLAWYANRDSLSYIDTYQLQDVSTFVRTTLRYPSFCRGWNKIIKLDLTNKNDHEEIKNSKTFADWFNLKKTKFASQNEKSFNENYFFNSEFSEQINYLGLKEEEKIPEEISTSALLLQSVLEKKLVMKPDDKDMIIMLHEIEYSRNGENKKTRSCLIVKGEDQVHTAMAKTVGLPLGIAAKLILEDKIKLSGLHIPVIPEIYEPVLQELEFHRIKFNEATEIL
ncbi:MAG TPA: saccharopine dehydrogenase C-terminal domain-containing protein [Hanamia sp.]|nr:saccharopine dehydrogenase C-terminal domain-containing protein [Hanamia sp.]